VLAFITGSGFYSLPGMIDVEPLLVETDYGDVTVSVGKFAGSPVAFLPRHGSDHSVPPHRINYRANLSALASVGATAILATAVSGSIDPEVLPGSLRLIDQFIDFTNGRPLTFFDDDVRHTDMTEPYDLDLRSLLLASAEAEGIEIVPTGTYICTNGPRFETPAEIKMAGLMGAHLVGMTGCPEVVLANELGIAYASIGVVSNMAAGLSGEPVSLDEINRILQGTVDQLARMFSCATERFSSGRP